MTNPRNQDTTNLGRSPFARPRRFTAVVALSVGAGSLLYGTILALPTASAASTASVSPSPSCGSTASASASPSGTATGTVSASPSSTDSSTPTETATATATGTDSASPSSTATGTGTGTATASPTKTATGTPTATDCATKTATATATATGTATATRSASATPSKTKTSAAPTTSKAAPTSALPTPTPAGYTSIPVYGDTLGTSGYFAYNDVPPGDAAYQLAHGSITRAQVIARAELWIQAQVPYSQTEWFTNRNGTYRQDCSGYVSMAWGLDQNTDFWTGNLNLVSYTIPASELLPGDILLSVKHTILFAGWANADHTQFNYMEEAHPGTVARFVEDAPLAAFLDNGFAPFRYDGIEDSGAVPADPASGELYATLSKLASEIDPPNVSALEPLGLNGSSAPGLSSAQASADRIAAELAADDVVSSEGMHSEGMVLGASGVFLVGAGLLMRRPFSLRGYRRKH
ncbi:MAG TPA: hypothetical protein VFN97_29455 [Actinospica sp.]|nr:hypothetical protein [Actinospica sp.]